MNNRQAGRRRGRNNNPRQNGGGNRGGGDSGNRIDSRARGNAAQLLEKYRNMARDAQMSGDRVNAEYYLQFADHYFRVLADNRARQEEAQNRHRMNNPSDDFDGDEGEGDVGFNEYDRFDIRPEQYADGNRGHGGQHRPRSAEEGNVASTGEGSSDEQGRSRDYADAPAEDRDRPRRGRPPRSERPDRQNDRQDRAERQDLGDRERAPRVERPQPAEQAESVAAPAPIEEAPRRGRPPRASRKPAAPQDEGSLSLDAALLPPSISQVESPAANDSDAAAEDAPAPRRRGRRPRAAAEAAE